MAFLLIHLIHIWDGQQTFDIILETLNVISFLYFWELQVFVDLVCFGWVTYFNIFHVANIFIVFNHFWSYKGNFGNKETKT